MSAPELTRADLRPSGAATGAGPADRSIDRRAFLTRMAALSATAAGATVALPRVAGGLVGTTGVPLANPDGYAREVRPEVLADPTEATIAEAAALIRRGVITPVDLLEAYLARIATFEGTYQAFNLVLNDAARAEAARLTRAGDRAGLGVLFGIPLAIKDNYFTAGVATTANSFIFQDFVPPYDATCVARLRAAGAVVLGKTQMGPLATTRATTPLGEVTTVNAWAPERPAVDPSGSSSGSATATAGRLATSSTGTQTGGSITGPANAQGLTGLKPTMGRASLHGIIPLSYTRDHPGPLARDARDAAIMLTAMAGPDPDDFRTLGLPPVPNLITAATPVRSGSSVRLRFPTRVGVLPGYTAGTSPTAAARSAMLSTLADLGAQVVEVPLPDEWDLLTGTAFNNVRLPERSEAFLPFLKQDVRSFGVSLTGWVQGLFLSGDEFLKGQRAKTLLLERVLEQFDRCDVVVQTGPVPFDIIGLPEIAFPIGFSSEATTANPAPAVPLPLGAILGGLPYAEDRLVSVVAAYQAVTDWHLRRPADPARGGATAATGARGARSARDAAAAPGLRLTPAQVEATSQ